MEARCPAPSSFLPVAPLDGAKAWRILPYGWRWLGGQWQARRPKSSKPRKGNLRAVQAPAAQLAGNTGPMDVDDPEAARVVTDLLERMKKK
ncbi:MAG: hypothetical protein JWN73_1723 [Betaproteobacteria bacterium]|nr:hypothetical protein [Betaproteobacteria bacterium]